VLTQYRLDNDVAKNMRRRFGAYVKGLRVDAALTQQQVAKALGYEYYTFVSQIERGFARVPPEDIQKWAKVLRVDVSEFAKRVLFFFDPYTYHAIFGGKNPLAMAAEKSEHETGTRLR
jgi:transcriptional regulator with XRE-family HTH domain